MAEKKYYAVASGRVPGIYHNWPEAEKQVRGFAGARFKGFTSEAEARVWLKNPGSLRRGPARQKSPPPSASVPPAGAILVYTDGGCSGNPGPGGFGVVIDDADSRRELSGGFQLTTNNRMEMTAAIVALEQLQGCGKPVLLYSDSAYLVNGINQGWAEKWRSRGWRKSDGTPALNIDLWTRLLSLLEGLNVTLYWVKGHAGNELNERCDQLAVVALRGEQLPADLGYESTGANT
ncbi:MAG TPA: ribonuclease HI [Desulforhopalus sp.]|nr:ribonuclease HI [Desulforhopalus sp.]